MRRHNFDYVKYGGQLYPDENIFIGPITVRELTRSLELDEQLTKMKKNTKLTAAPIDEETENQLDRTFNLDDTEKLNTTFEVQSDREDNQTLVPQEPLKDISNMTVTSALVNLNIADSPFDQSTRKYNTPRKKTLLDDTVKSIIRENLQTPLIDKLPQKCTINVDVEEARVSSSSEVAGGITKTRDNLRTTKVRKNTQIPMINKVSKKCLTTKTGVETVPFSLQNNDDVKEVNNDLDSVSTPVTKLSDTFITDLTEKGCLVESPLNDAITRNTSAKNQKTPDVFLRKRNDMWKNDSSIKKSGGGNHFKFKHLQMSRTQYFKSPVAEYIHKGRPVQSMSKLRHSHCIASEEITKSKSDNKSNKICKIPVSINVAAKRKLNLMEIKSAVKK